MSAEDLRAPSLGECSVTSPLPPETLWVEDGARVLVSTDPGELASGSFERAGPRRRIFFEPRAMRVGIVTCGGMCPGINNVVRALVLELHHKYGVREVLGFRFGFEGLDPETDTQPMGLGPSEVRSIHKAGGSILGLSRGAHDPAGMADTLVRRRIDALFAIGGDGTLRGARALHEEIARRGARIAIIGVPKTIDNDVPFVDKTFGFDTAVELACLAIDAAHTEATGVRNGVGIVRLMGREAGFIAAAATLASAEANFCLIPEAPFDLYGERGLLAAIEQRLAARGHAVVVVAEGCSAHLARADRDASGNPSYSSAEADVGPRLRDTIAAYLREAGVGATIKYIDPSYMIRSVPASATDAILCGRLARDAVHAAMAGKTGILVGRWHRAFTHVPLGLVVKERRRVGPDLWQQVLDTTGQPPLR
jgi:6-phosphofructokinase 1